MPTAPLSKQSESVNKTFSPFYSVGATCLFTPTPTPLPSQPLSPNEAGDDVESADSLCCCHSA